MSDSGTLAPMPEAGEQGCEVDRLCDGARAHKRRGRGRAVSLCVWGSGGIEGTRSGVTRSLAPQP
jgi:hypothetical protein